jgi:hypothetical protein
MTIAAMPKARHAIRGGFLVLVVGGLGLLSGCGSDSDTAEVTVPTAPNGKSVPVDVKRFDQALAAAESKNCEAKPCTAGGVRVLVGGPGDTLKLKDLNATLLEVETSKSISDRFETTKTADGTYVVLLLEIVSKLDYEWFFDGNQEQAYLYLGNRGYSEDFEVENYALETSFVNNRDPLSPGEVRKESIAFDVPSNLIPELKKSGNLILLNSSEEGRLKTAKELGVIRTYE